LREERSEPRLDLPENDSLGLRRVTKPEIYINRSECGISQRRIPRKELHLAARSSKLKRDEVLRLKKNPRSNAGDRSSRRLFSVCLADTELGSQPATSEPVPPFFFSCFLRDIDSRRRIIRYRHPQLNILAVESLADRARRRYNVSMLFWT